MKKLVVLTLVFGLCSTGNAYTVKISVNGVADPPDTTINLEPSQWAVIDIHVTDNTGWPSSGIVGFVVIQGAGSIVIPEPPELYLWEQSTINKVNWPEPYDTYKDYLEPIYPDITDILEFEIKDTSPPITLPLGRVIDGLVLHCESYEPIGDVTLTLFDVDLNVLDSQVIHQVPEPMTLALLGLGGLFLRRRK
jgi:hypothetical protein